MPTVPLVPQCKMPSFGWFRKPLPIFRFKRPPFWSYMEVCFSTITLKHPWSLAQENPSRTPPVRCQRGPLQPARPSGWSRSEWQSSGGQMPGDLILLLFWYGWKGRCNLSPSVLDYLDCMMCWVWLFDKDLVWFRPFTPRKHIGGHEAVETRQRP